MKLLIQLNESALFADKIYAVEPSEEIDKEMFIESLDNFDYNARDLNNVLFLMEMFPSSTAIFTEYGQEGVIYNITHATPAHIQKLTTEWTKEPELAEIQKMSRGKKDKRKYDEYLMSGSGSQVKTIKEIKPDYFPAYRREDK